MKHKVPTLIIAVSLALAAVGIAIVKASITPDPFTIHSPINKTYDSRIVTLDVSFIVGMGGGKYSVLCYIDGEYVGTVPFTVEGTEEFHITYPARGIMDLPALPDGSHSVTVVLTWTGGVRGYPSNNDTAHFRIDSDEPNPPPIRIIDSNPPKISLLMPMGFYNSSDIQLSFTVDEAFSKAYYSLDEMDNVTIIGNITLSGLSNGLHNVTVYASDLTGNVGASETILFNVSVQQSPQPFPTKLVITASGASIVVVTAALLVYFKKRKRQRLE